MNGDVEEKKVAIAHWADKYTARFDQELTNAWPDLEDCLDRAVDALSLYQLAAGAGEAFAKEHIQPQVGHWFDRHVQPLLNEATTEFQNLVGWEPDWNCLGAQTQADARGVFQKGDLLGVSTVPIGVGVGTAGTVLAMKTVAVKVFWVITIGKATVIAWPVLIVGLAIGTVLSWFGVHWLAGMKGTFQKRLKDQLYPTINEALLGAGVTYQNTKLPSLKDHLVARVRETANTARGRLDRGE
jgi:hypothetical protein